MKPMSAVRLLPLALLGASISGAAAGACKSRNLDFIVKEGDPEALVIEDDIREDLDKIGIKLNTVFLDDEAYSEAERNGSYHLLLSRTWVRVTS